MPDIAAAGDTMPEKRPMGRPSLYRPEYCEQVIELGKLGYSEVQISAELDVPRTTMRSWAEKHQEFSSSLARAKELEQAFWEHMGMDNINERCFQSSVWAKSMQARFRHDYTERREVEQTTQVIDNTSENSDIRKVARAILAIMERAELEDLPPIIDAQADTARGSDTDSDDS